MLPYMMAVVLPKEEWLGEILDVRMLLVLPTSNANLHLIATFVNAEFALVRHVAIGCRRNDLDGVC
jgi:hypothetical protein